MIRIKFMAACSIILCCCVIHAKPRVAISIDDPNYEPRPLFDYNTRNEKILNALELNGLQGILFVCGKRVDSDTGRSIVSEWNDRGHIIANHSYSHYYYHARNMSVDIYAADFLRCDSIISGYSSFEKLFRYPYLKEGNNEVKRDYFREVLKSNGYNMGYVSIDASDWYIDGRLINRLKENPQADITPYRDFYLKHIMERAAYYNELAVKVLGREPDHVLLIHHSLLNALFLNDLIQKFKDLGWDVIDAGDAYKDEIYTKLPLITPAGESIIWALAKETGKFDDVLRYPAEDGVYEEEEMDRLGL